VVDSKFTIP